MGVGCVCGLGIGCGVGLAGLLVDLRKCLTTPPGFRKSPFTAADDAEVAALGTEINQ